MLTFSDDNYKKAFLAIRAVCHEKRREIIEHLRSKGRSCVTAIHYELKCDQSIASQHLKILRDAGVVTRERVGRFIHYSLNEAKLDDLNSLVSLLE
jgi:DNA-binding transcriptional ArsR family regulator